ncbi:MAG: hypothetical protein D4R73_02945 [Deltaproteobacteria bacterium]|nr:MAG: hypothetical protein D4R73_02945 [Deltaproteobacteria bacterium]
MSSKKRVEKTVWVPVEGLDFEMLVRYLPRSELTRMLERATESTWDRQTGQNVDRINPKKLLAEYAGVILDWRGLTREIYARLIPIEPSEYPEEIPCTDEYKRELLEEAYGLDAVVRQICTDLARFQDERQEEERKNS